MGHAAPAHRLWKVATIMCHILSEPVLVFVALFLMCFSFFSCRYFYVWGTPTVITIDLFPHQTFQLINVGNNEVKSWLLCSSKSPSRQPAVKRVGPPHKWNAATFYTPVLSLWWQAKMSAAAAAALNSWHRTYLSCRENMFLLLFYFFKCLGDFNWQPSSHMLLFVIRHIYNQVLGE